jgi:hypothetical protein
VGKNDLPCVPHEHQYPTEEDRLQQQQASSFFCFVPTRTLNFNLFNHDVSGGFKIG